MVRSSWLSAPEVTRLPTCSNPAVQMLTPWWWSAWTGSAETPPSKSSC